MHINDKQVQQTNDDVTSAKLSCVSAGYYDDEFVHLFCSQNPPKRRNPIINLGHYIRVMTIRRVIEVFLNRFGEEVQIVSLGAGFDTNAFWILKSFAHVKIFELDFPNVIYRKLKIIEREWRGALSFMANDQPFSSEEESWSNGKLSLISCDLRLSVDEEIGKKLHACGFNKNKPTLVLSECCLIYLDYVVSEGLLTFFSTLGSRVVFGVYEQVNGQDRFGKMMLDNLHERGCPLLSILSTPEAVTDRFYRCGFGHVRVELMSHFSNFIKTKRVEMIDEVEEFSLFQNHYFLGIACNFDFDLAEIFTRNDNA